MEKLNSIQNKIHHLAQFPAAFGTSYLPKADDDSQSNLEWTVGSHVLTSRSVNDVSLSLGFKDLVLMMTKNNTVKKLKLPGLTHHDIDFWIRETLTVFGLDASLYHYDLGFSLDTTFDNFTVFDQEEKEIISNLSKQRDMAQRGMRSVAKKYGSATEIRIWPHHFDTGMLLDLSEEKNMSKGIGLGYAIADAVCQVPYFYVYAWPDKEIPYGNLPVLKQGIWVIEDWKGALLTINMHYNNDIVKLFYHKVVTCFAKLL